MIDRMTPSTRPNQRVVMYQNWSKILLLHWPVPVEMLRPLIPESLEIDTFDGQAYVSLVPFTMNGIRPRGFPSVKHVSDFHEINVRTYVVHNGVPGVWFFSLDAANRMAVKLARTWFHLPYHHASIDLTQERDRITYTSIRKGEKSIECQLKYLITGAPIPTPPGSLNNFLVERYILFTEYKGRLMSGQVHHVPYPLQTAKLESLEESMVQSVGVVRAESAPIVHYAEGLNVEIFPLKRVIL